MKTKENLTSRNYVENYENNYTFELDFETFTIIANVTEDVRSYDCSTHRGNMELKESRFYIEIDSCLDHEGDEVEDLTNEQIIELVEYNIKF